MWWSLELIEMPIFTDLRFHLHGIDELDMAWEQLETVFRKHNEIRGHQLENELVTLAISLSFKTIYLSTKPLDS